MKRHKILQNTHIGYHGKKLWGIFVAKKTFTWLIYLFVIITTLSTTGCGGLMIRQMEKGSSYNYSTLNEHSTPLPANSGGRLFVYLVDGGPNIMNTIGVISFCTVDEGVYGIMGKTFWYIDLPIGKHKITVDGVSRFGMNYGYGNNFVEFDLKEGETKYCRIDPDLFLVWIGLPAWATLNPLMMEQSVAEKEMMDLDSYNNFRKNKKVTH